MPSFLRFVPQQWQSKAADVRDDLRRIRKAFEDLARGMDELAANPGGGGAGTITSVSSPDGSIAVGGGSGPAVTLDVDEAELENGGSHELNVGGLSGELADPQRADTLVESSGPTDLAVGAVASGQFLARSGSTVIGANPVAPVFWGHRTGSEHADSDEFTAGTIGANWSLRRGDTHAVVTPVGDVDPTSAVTTVTSPRFSANYRGTFAAMQGLQTTTQPLELARVMSARPANFHLRFRLSMPSWKHVGGSGGTTNARSAVFLAPDTAGLPDFSGEYAQLGWVVNGSNQTLASAVGVSGGVPVVGESSTVLIASPFDVEFLLAMNNAGSVSFYIRNEGGLVRMATHSLTVAAGNPLWVVWMGHGNIGGGVLIYTCDYILQQNDLVLPS